MNVQKAIAKGVRTDRFPLIWRDCANSTFQRIALDPAVFFDLDLPNLRMQYVWKILLG